MTACPTCGAPIATPVAPALLFKAVASMQARAALLGIVAVRTDLDCGTPALALSCGAWTETLPLRQAESLLDALAAVMRPGDANG